MKLKSMLFICLILFSCKNLKNIEEKPYCPKGYECHTELIENKYILIFEDTTKEIYIKLEDNEGFHVVKYTFKHEGKTEIADDTYLEAIYFQIPQDTKSLTLSDKELAKVKLIAQKSCFCRDAGYELVKIGHLNIEKQKDTYYIDIQFESSRNMEVSNLQTTVKLKG